MAILQQPVNNSNPFGDAIGEDLAPAGTYVATVVDVKDEFGVVRQKFQSTEMETVDLTCFLFGFRDAMGYEHRVASRRMKISGNEKSTLFGFLKSILGRAPQYGWDYCELKGRQCLLTIEHQPRRDGAGVFTSIAALSPVPQGMGGAAMPPSGQSAMGSGQTGRADAQGGRPAGRPYGGGAAPGQAPYPAAAPSVRPAQPPSPGVAGYGAPGVVRPTGAQYPAQGPGPYPAPAQGAGAQAEELPPF